MRPVGTQETLYLQAGRFSPMCGAVAPERSSASLLNTTKTNLVQINVLRHCSVTTIHGLHGESRGLLGEGWYQETLTNSCWDSTSVLLEERGMPLLLDGLHKQVAL